jgi:hypothetical protein
MYNNSVLFNTKSIRVSEYIHVILKPLTPSRLSLAYYYVHHARVGDVTYAMIHDPCLYRERSLSIAKIFTK